MANGQQISDYISYGSGAPSGAPSVGVSGQWAIYQDTATGIYYGWNLFTTAWTALGGGGGFSAIASTVLGAPAANITFSSIAGTYKALEVHLLGASSASATLEALQVQMNADTGSNYDAERLTSTASAGGANEALAQTSAQVGYVAAATGVANGAGMVKIIIPAYTSTAFRKLFSSLGGVDSGDTSGSKVSAYLLNEWRSTAAITSIKLFPAAGNFVTGTFAALYGLS